MIQIRPRLDPIRIELRDASEAYASQQGVVHYWRLGDDSSGVGFDYGSGGEPIDIDDPSGGIDEGDIVADVPQAL